MLLKSLEYSRMRMRAGRIVYNFVTAMAQKNLTGAQISTLSITGVWHTVSKEIINAGFIE